MLFYMKYQHKMSYVCLSFVVFINTEIKTFKEMFLSHLDIQSYFFNCKISSELKTIACKHLSRKYFLNSFDWKKNRKLWTAFKQSSCSSRLWTQCAARKEFTSTIASHPLVKSVPQSQWNRTTTAKVFTIKAHKVQTWWFSYSAACAIHSNFDVS